MSFSFAPSFGDKVRCWGNTRGIFQSRLNVNLRRTRPYSILTTMLHLGIYLGPEVNTIEVTKPWLCNSVRLWNDLIVIIDID